MTGEKVNFETEFYNLKGDSIKERKANFFKLLHTKSLFPDEEQQLSDIIQTLQPRTFLESLFKIDLLIHFKRSLELLKIIKEGNEIFASKIIKHQWFFKDIFQDAEPDKIINEFLPDFPFSFRKKIIKGILEVLDHSQIDQIFDCLVKRYGLYLANTFLHKCSSNKIRETLNKTKMELQPNQVKYIFDTDRELFIFYMDHYKNLNKNCYDKDGIINYIAKKDLKFLIQLKNEHRINYFCAGRQTTKKIIKLSTETAIKYLTSPGHVNSVRLKESVAVRNLRGGVFNQVFFSIFPRNVPAWYYDLKMLSFYPKKRQWDLFVQTFSKVHKDKTLHDILEILKTDFFKMCPDKELKYKGAEILFASTNSNSYLKYYPTQKAIPMIKDKINVTSDISEREHLLTLFIMNCAENDDLKALEGVLKYFCYRHKNEQDHVKIKFLQKISSSIGLDKLNEIHWNYVNEAVILLKLKQACHISFQHEFGVRFLEFLLREGKPFITELKNLAALLATENEEIRGFLPNAAYEREIMLQIINLVPELEIKNSTKLKWYGNIIDFSLQKKEHYFIDLLTLPNVLSDILSVFEQTHFDFNFINNVFRYNLAFPDRQVRLTDQQILNVIKAGYEHQPRYLYSNFIKEMVTRKDRSKLQNDLLSYYFETFSDPFNRTDIITWYLVNEPKTLVEHRKNIEQKIHDMPFVKQWKMYSHFGFDAMFINYFRNRLFDSEIIPNNKGDIVKNLAGLLSTDEFVKLTLDYLPIKEKLDLEDEKMHALYVVQCFFATFLKDIHEPVKMLPIVIKFCLGDYLQSALGSLYSICYRVPEKILPEYLNELSKKSVSVRKHSVFLTCELLDYHYAINTLKSFKDTNDSSQKHILNATIKYFKKHPSADLLSLLVSYMSFVNENDCETLGKLINLEMDEQYGLFFVPKCWKCVEDINKSNNAILVDRHLVDLVYKMIGSQFIVVNLSRDFLLHIFDNYYQSDKNEIYNLHKLLVQFLIQREHEFRENLKYIFSILHNFKSQRKYDRIKQFFMEFFVCSSKSISLDILTSFSNCWSNLFTAFEWFKEFFLLQMLQIKLQVSDPFIKNFSIKVAEYLQHLISGYGLHIYEKYKNFVMLTLDNFSTEFKEEIDKLTFYLKLLEYSPTPTNCILFFDLIGNKEKFYENETLEIYNSIVEITKSVSDPIVKIYYNDVFF